MNKIKYIILSVSLCLGCYLTYLIHWTGGCQIGSFRGRPAEMTAKYFSVFYVDIQGLTCRIPIYLVAGERGGSC